MNFRARMAYRGDFVMALFMGIAWQTSVLVFAGVLLARFGSLDGWSQGDVLLIASMRLLAHGIYVAVFSNLERMPVIVQDGLLDGYLMRPLPVYRQILLHRFPANALGDTSAAVTLFTLTLLRLHLAWTPMRLCYLSTGVIGGTFAEAAAQTVISAISFKRTIGMSWSIWVDNLFATFGNYPLKILPSAVRSVLIFVIPIGFTAYLPAAAITGMVPHAGVPGWLVLSSPAWGPVLFLLSRMLWNRALRGYEALGG